MNIEKTVAQVMDYCEFTNDTAYILLLLPRKKENQDSTERDKLRKRTRYLVQNEEDVRYALTEFERTGNVYPDTVFRVYISVNRRSLLKGMREFQQKIMQYQYDIINGNTEIWTKVAKMGSDWKSVLASKVCRDERYFMFDIDLCNKTQREEADAFVADVEKLTDVKYIGESKSGFCLVTRGFDLNPLKTELVDPNAVEGDKDFGKKKLPHDIEMKADAYMYLSMIN